MKIRNICKAPEHVSFDPLKGRMANNAQSKDYSIVVNSNGDAADAAGICDSLRNCPRHEELGLHKHILKKEVVLNHVVPTSGSQLLAATACV